MLQWKLWRKVLLVQPLLFLVHGVGSGGCRDYRLLDGGKFV